MDTKYTYFLRASGTGRASKKLNVCSVVEVPARWTTLIGIYLLDIPVSTLPAHDGRTVREA